MFDRLFKPNSPTRILYLETIRRSDNPTERPSKNPTANPTERISKNPTMNPTNKPTEEQFPANGAGLTLESTRDTRTQDPIKIGDDEDISEAGSISLSSSSKGSSFL